MDKITDERLKEIVDKTYCRLDEGESMAAELLALRSRVGWLDHLDTAEGRAMHATEVVRVENEQVRAQRDSLAATLIEVQREFQAARADLRDAIKLLRAHGQAPSRLLSAGKFGAVKDWNRRYGELLAKHKDTP